MEQYMSKTRTDYGSGVARPKIDNKDHFELKGQFLKELRENTFSGSDNEDANEHIEKVLEIVSAAQKNISTVINSIKLLMLGYGCRKGFGIHAWQELLMLFVVGFKAAFFVRDKVSTASCIREKVLILLVLTDIGSFWRLFDDVITKRIDYCLFDVVVEFHRVIFRIMLHGGYFEYWKAGLVVVVYAYYVWCHVQGDLKSRGSIEDSVSFWKMITSQLLYLRGSSYGTLFVLSSSNRERLLGF
ncbi:hypothetical protein Tco_1458213 [Tanacetum coccineum]